MKYDILYELGFYGPYILFYVNVCLMIQYPKYLLMFIFCSLFVVTPINKALKYMIREQRPTGYNTYHSSYDKGDYTGVEKYGMPSGHAQTSFFSVIYTWCVTKNNELLILELFLVALTLYQRWACNRHSTKQLVAGSIVGSGLAYAIYSGSKKYLFVNYGK